MFLETFSLPKPDVRLITLNDTIYKIKLYLVKPPRHRSNYGQTTLPKNQEDIEAGTDTDESSQFKRKRSNKVDGAIKNTEWKSTFTGNKFPDRKKWEIADKVAFYKHEKLLECCPYVHSFYIEDKTGNTVRNEKANIITDKEYISDSENEDNKSISFLDGINQSHFSSSEEIQETSEDDEREDSKTYEKTTSSEPSDLVIINSQKRKIQNEIPSEEKSKRKKYSVSEYVDKNRHEVQEQDLQEQLRFQELASPADEKAASETNKTSFERVVSTFTAMKKWFGSS